MKTLYLDTSDLSYLVKGHGPQHMGDVVQHRARLERLMQADRVRVIVSDVHTAEIALDPETRTAALQWFAHGPPVWCFPKLQSEIFRAELLGEEVATRACDLVLSDVKWMRSSSAGSGVAVAHRMKDVYEWIARGKNASKWAARRRPWMTRSEHVEKVAKESRTFRAILRNDRALLSPSHRLVAWGFRGITRLLSAKFGFRIEEDFFARHVRLEDQGLSWIDALIEYERVDDAVKRVGSPVHAPASALRAAIEKKESGDKRRNATSSTAYDVQHLAYAAHCDIATIDAFNYRTTAKVRAALARPVFFRVARIADVLAEIERDG